MKTFYKKKWDRGGGTQGFDSGERLRGLAQEVAPQKSPISKVYFL
ncbi:hypothetical protein 268TH004_2 [Bacillus phage 268TH004]|uniref:Uncharacterized protein n=1 Tax=Bacillus phage 268TH004 TaxID=2801523 RepID=A0A7T7ZAK9_9CAUD|nr:hypothetical protein 268TH004_2 [Bacillus phage 268TH004]